MLFAVAGRPARLISSHPRRLTVCLCVCVSQEFINSKVSAKANRQLQDPVIVMTGNTPQWLQQIGLAW